uniref:Uncharacterized protein n=1 Tax=Arundo donax TaxID=35708 RepID=A0A0A8YVK6_ARUDO
MAKIRRGELLQAAKIKAATAERGTRQRTTDQQFPAKKSPYGADEQQNNSDGGISGSIQSI